MAASDDRPIQLVRVVADIGFGWPERTRVERKRRTFTSRADAARWIANVRALPSHHTLVAVYETDTAWQPISLDEEVARIAAEPERWEDE